MKALVTGGAGFIGSHLVDALLAEGHQVRVLDDFSTGKRANLTPQPHLTIVEGSVTDPRLVAAAIEDCQAVYHLAAAIGVRYVMDDALSGIAVNVRGTEEVLAASARVGARVVIASSSEVYGKGRSGADWQPFREDGDSIIGPTHVTRWWYALAKGLDEHLAFAYHRQRDLPVSAVRYFNIYGPRCDPGGYGVLARFISQALKAEPLTVFGDGEQTRSFTYVDDAVRATILAGARPTAVGEAFNVGSSAEMSINAAASAVLHLTNSPSAIHYLKHVDVFGGNFEDTRRRVPDIAKAERLLGFTARVDIVEGIRRTMDWWRANTHLT
ncbi:MAG TPA: NAD-dependent epimerase/dehydratase family protein [Chloroflexota bacterium]|nr:NAD-dependent epimerase/dehydratase family protein [Chloroflexota bacterium]